MASERAIMITDAPLDRAGPSSRSSAVKAADGTRSGRSAVMGDETIDTRSQVVSGTMPAPTGPGWPHNDDRDSQLSRTVGGVERDSRAHERDHRADDRDSRAAERDARAEERESADDFQGAGRDRTASASDRQDSASDRHGAAVDRIHAARDQDA